MHHHCLFRLIDFKEVSALDFMSFKISFQRWKMFKIENTLKIQFKQITLDTLDSKNIKHTGISQLFFKKTSKSIE